MSSDTETNSVVIRPPAVSGSYASSFSVSRALGGWNLGENLLGALFLELFEGVGAIVRRHLRDELGRLTRGHRLENFGAQLLVEVLENIRRALDGQRGQEGRDHLARKRFRQRREIVGVQLLGLGRNSVRTLLEHDEDVRQEQRG